MQNPESAELLTSKHLEVVPALRKITATYIAGLENRTGKDQEEDRKLLEGLAKLQELWTKKGYVESAIWRTEEFDDTCTRMDNMRTFRRLMGSEEKGD